MGRLPENHPTFSYLSNEPYFKSWTERQKLSNDQLMETKKNCGALHDGRIKIRVVQVGRWRQEPFLCCSLRLRLMPEGAKACLIAAPPLLSTLHLLHSSSELNI